MELTYFGFADDHILKNSFVPKVPEAEEEAIINLEKVSVEVKKWMDSNKLKMNCSKQNFLCLAAGSNYLSVQQKTLTSIETL